MRNHKSLISLAIILLVVAIQGAGKVSADIITQIVEFTTASGSTQNQFAVKGRLNTLAQGLGEVDCGDTQVSIAGLLTAQLTLNVPREGPIEILGFEFLSSSFTQSGINLFYDVPNTARQITFSATGLQFGLQFNGQNNSQQPLTAGPNIPSNSYQMVQNTGTAEVGITNRPSRQQNLTQQSVLSTYQGNQPVGQASFSILPPSGQSNNSLVELNLPLSNQQMYYAGVGLPVTLNYSGTLSLVGAVSPVTSQIPEPGTVALVGGGLLMLILQRRRMAVRG